MIYLTPTLNLLYAVGVRKYLVGQKCVLGLLLRCEFPYRETKELVFTPKPFPT